MVKKYQKKTARGEPDKLKHSLVQMLTDRFQNKPANKEQTLEQIA